jgi:bacterial/archaeal transporter family protein
MNWTAYALLSALFAGLTAVLAKIGVQGVPSNLATAVRTVVVLVFAAAIVLARGEARHLPELSSRTWLFLTLSGIATGLSWLCYFRALQLGPVSRVAPIDKLSFVIAAVLGLLLFHERATWQLMAGLVLIAAGVLLTLQG